MGRHLRHKVARHTLEFFRISYGLRPPYNVRGWRGGAAAAGRGRAGGTGEGGQSCVAAGARGREPVPRGRDNIHAARGAHRGASGDARRAAARVAVCPRGAGAAGAGLRRDARRRPRRAGRPPPPLPLPLRAVVSRPRSSAIASTRTRPCRLRCASSRSWVRAHWPRAGPAVATARCDGAAGSQGTGTTASCCSRRRTRRCGRWPARSQACPCCS